MITCEQCQDLLSEFLDNELEPESSATVRDHIAVCPECSLVYEDLAMLIDASHLETDENAVPPNSRALWCRINNIIEGEIKPEIAREHEQPAESGWLPRRWSLSFSQVFAAVVGIALVSSLLTVIGIRQYTIPDDEFGVRSEPSLIDRMLGKVGLVETSQQARQRKMREREAAIEYWDRRVQARRAQWGTHLREAFDRNLNEINQAVSEYTLILQENPQDELSGEMLDSALNEKMELLREFSEL